MELEKSEEEFADVIALLRRFKETFPIPPPSEMAIIHERILQNIKSKLKAQTEEVILEPS